METLRIIEHNATHTDIEALIFGEWVVVKCIETKESNMPQFRVFFHTKHNPDQQSEIIRAMDERELLDIYDITGAIVDDYEEVTPHPVTEAQQIERAIDATLHAEDFDSTPTPSDMPVINFDDVQEVEY